MNKKIFVFSLLIISMIAVLSGCSGGGSGSDNIIRASGDIVTREFLVGNFTGIDALFSDVVVRHANEHRIVVEVAENLVDFTDNTIRHGVLSVRFNPGPGIGVEFGSHRPRITFYTPNIITSLNLRGGSAVIEHGPIITRNFSIEANGNSNVSLNLVVENLWVTTSSFATVALNGSTNNVNVEANSSSNVRLDLDSVTNNVSVDASSFATVALNGSANIMNIHAESSSLVLATNMPTNDVQIRASSLSRAGVDALERLDVTASSSSQVQYLKRPTDTRIEILSLATVTQEPGTFGHGNQF